MIFPALGKVVVVAHYGIYGDTLRTMRLTLTAGMAAVKLTAPFPVSLLHPEPIHSGLLVLLK